MRIKIKESVEERIVKHCEKTEEVVCGFVFGIDGELRIINEFKKATNVSEKPTIGYEISPEEYIQAELHASKTNQQLLGIVHSHHTQSAIPSQTDADKALPYFSYLIIGKYGRYVSDIKSWRLNDFNILEEEQLILESVNV